MEKLRREMNELSESKARLSALIDYLANEKNLMASKANHIFMLDMQDYIAALDELAPSTTEVPIGSQDIKQINYLLTQQYELIKTIQRDYSRNESPTNPDQEVVEKREKLFKRLKVINQLLLQDNIIFQSALDHKLIGGNIRIGKKKNWLQRLLRR